MVDVEIDIEANDDASPTINIITNTVTHLHQAQQQQMQTNRRWQDTISRMAKPALAAAKAVGKVVSSVAAVAAATGPAVSGLLAVGKALAVVGKAGARLTPLAAFIPSLLGAFALVSTTLKVAGPGLARAFEPITSQFRDAKGEAAGLAKILQRVVGIDVKPAAAQFVKVNFPAIAHAMERIAYQTNLVIAGTLKWANSARGVAAIKNLSRATADAFTALTPKLINVVEKFGELAGRAGDPAIKGLGDLIGRILDRLAAWADNTTIQDINRALEDLSGYGTKLRDTWANVKAIGRWLAENQGMIKNFSNVAAGGAVALGVATGNVPAIVLGAATLIINNWKKIEPIFNDAIGWVKRMADAWQKDAGRIAIAESIVKALEGAKQAFADATSTIGPKWRLFIQSIKLAWEEWAPLIKLWWDNGGAVAFKAAGAALGAFVQNLVIVGIAVVTFARGVVAGFKWLVNFVLAALGGIIKGAAVAFGWIPGIGPKLDAASREFDAFAQRVNKALDGIDPLKTIRINANVYVTGGNTAAGGVDQRTGNSRNAGLSGLSSWQRAAAALFEGAAGGGGSRTGGPTPLVATVNNTINLDGRPFRAYTDRVVLEAEERAQWRAGNRR